MRGFATSRQSGGLLPVRLPLSVVAPSRKLARCLIHSIQIPAVIDGRAILGQQIFEYLFSSEETRPGVQTGRDQDNETGGGTFYSTGFVAKSTPGVLVAPKSWDRRVSNLPVLPYSGRCARGSVTVTFSSFEYIFLLCGAIRRTWCTSSTDRQEIFIRSSWR